MADRALVHNATDPQQVRRGERKVRERAELRRTRLAHVLSSALGRAALWDLLESCGTFRSVWANGQEMAYKAGRQDLGHELMARLVEADEHAYLAMEAEARARTRREAQDTAAAQTAARGGAQDGSDDSGREG